MKFSQIWIGLFLLSGCASSPKTDQKRTFLSVLSDHPEQIWASSISTQTRMAIQDYNLPKKLENGKNYGDSVRNLDLRHQCYKEITEHLKELNCPMTLDYLKDPKTKKYLLSSLGLGLGPGSGQKIPMTVFLCEDGGVVRVKPMGDPTSRFRPQPHASKALRYPYNSKFESFDDEMAKVDPSGKVIPKWVKDLNTDQVSNEDKTQFITDWANDAHFDLNADCGPQR